MGLLWSLPSVPSVVSIATRISLIKSWIFLYCSFVPVSFAIEHLLLQIYSLFRCGLMDERTSELSAKPDTSRPSTARNGHRSAAVQPIIIQDDLRMNHLD